ncbi:hypothetical protein HDV00_011863 [Rhizophlyctis rosea]|nr:hypothetical protein HDV00_011863 [Rhizophlyctis rosea]
MSTAPLPALPGRDAAGKRTTEHVTRTDVVRRTPPERPQTRAGGPRPPREPSTTDDLPNATSSTKLRPTSSQKRLVPSAVLSVPRQKDLWEHRHYPTIHPTCNKLLSRRWEEHVKNLHLRKLKEARPSVDNKVPRRYPHLEMRLKRLQNEEERLYEIEKNNHILLDRIAFQISNASQVSDLEQARRMKQVETELGGHWKAAGTLNGPKRRKDWEKIQSENLTILQRIEDKAPYYDRRKWLEDRHKSLSYLANIAQYPLPYYRELGVIPDEAAAALFSMSAPTSRKVSEAGDESDRGDASGAEEEEGVEVDGRPVTRRGSGFKGTAEEMADEEDGSVVEGEESGEMAEKDVEQSDLPPPGALEEGGDELAELQAEQEQSMPPQEDPQAEEVPVQQEEAPQPAETQEMVPLPEEQTAEEPRELTTYQQDFAAPGQPAEEATQQIPVAEQVEPEPAQSEVEPQLVQEHQEEIEQPPVQQEPQPEPATTYQVAYADPTREPQPEQEEQPPAQEEAPEPQQPPLPPATQSQIFAGDEDARYVNYPVSSSTDFPATEYGERAMSRTAGPHGVGVKGSSSMGKSTRAGSRILDEEAGVSAAPPTIPPATQSQIFAGDEDARYTNYPVSASTDFPSTEFGERAMSRTGEPQGVKGSSSMGRSTRAGSRILEEGSGGSTAPESVPPATQSQIFAGDEDARYTNYPVSASTDFPSTEFGERAMSRTGGPQGVKGSSSMGRSTRTGSRILVEGGGSQPQTEPPTQAESQQPLQPATQSQIFAGDEDARYTNYPVSASTEFPSGPEYGERAMSRTAGPQGIKGSTSIKGSRSMGQTRAGSQILEEERTASHPAPQPQPLPPATHSQIFAGDEDARYINYPVSPSTEFPTGAEYGERAMARTAGPHGIKGSTSMGQSKAGSRILEEGYIGPATAREASQTEIFAGIEDARFFRYGGGGGSQSGVFGEPGVESGEGAMSRVGARGLGERVGGGKEGSLVNVGGEKAGATEQSSAAAATSTPQIEASAGSAPVRGSHPASRTASTAQLQQGPASRTASTAQLQQGPTSRTASTAQLQQGPASRTGSTSQLQQGPASRAASTTQLQQGFASRTASTGQLQQGPTARAASTSQLQPQQLPEPPQHDQPSPSPIPPQDHIATQSPRTSQQNLRPSSRTGSRSNLGEQDLTHGPAEPPRQTQRSVPSSLQGSQSNLVRPPSATGQQNAMSQSQKDLARHASHSQSKTDLHQPQVPLPESATTTTSQPFHSSQRDLRPASGTASAGQSQEAQRQSQRDVSQASGGEGPASRAGSSARLIEQQTGMQSSQADVRSASRTASNTRLAEQTGVRSSQPELRPASRAGSAAKLVEQSTVRASQPQLSSTSRSGSTMKLAEKPSAQSSQPEIRSSSRARSNAKLAEQQPTVRSSQPELTSSSRAGSTARLAEQQPAKEPSQPELRPTSRTVSVAKLTEQQPTKQPSQPELRPASRTASAAKLVEQQAVKQASQPELRAASRTASAAKLAEQQPTKQPSQPQLHPSSRTGSTKDISSTGTTSYQEEFKPPPPPAPTTTSRTASTTNLPARTGSTSQIPRATGTSNRASRQDLHTQPPSEQSTENEPAFATPPALPTAASQQSFLTDRVATEGIVTSSGGGANQESRPDLSGGGGVVACNEGTCG